MVETLKVRLDDDDELAPLTPEQLEIIAKAEADIDAGHFYTSEQVRGHFAQRWATALRENAA